MTVITDTTPGYPGGEVKTEVAIDTATIGFSRIIDSKIYRLILNKNIDVEAMGRVCAMDDVGFKVLATVILDDFIKDK